MASTLQDTPFSPVAARLGGRQRVVRHPVALFFALTLGIAWTLWGLLPAVLPLGPEVRGWLVAIGSWGPAFSALCVTRWLSQAPTTPARPRVRFAVFLGTWLLGMLGYLGFSVPVEEVSRPVWYVLIALASLVPAFILQAGLSGHRGWREWLGALRPRDVGAGWYFLALLLMPALALLQIGLSRLLGGPMPGRPTMLEGLWMKDPWLPFVLFVQHFIFGGPLGEEPGWRGFALRHLQARHSPLIASLLVGIPWWLWHVPLQLNDFGNGYASGLGELVSRMLFNVPIAILYTWLYNRTRGQLMPVLLLHFSFNETFALTGSYPSTEMLLLVMGGLVLADRMWRRLPAGSPCAAFDAV